MPRTVFAWLRERLTARRRDDLPLTEAALRADLALGFALETGADAVWPEVTLAAAGGGTQAGGRRLTLLVRREGQPLIGVECGVARRNAGERSSPAARQFGDLLRDALRLYQSLGDGGLPVQTLLCADEFRTYLNEARPPLRLLRPDSAGSNLRTVMPLADLEETTRNRLAESLSDDATALRLEFDMLGVAPVGPLHLAMWRVAEARLA